MWLNHLYPLHVYRAESRNTRPEICAIISSWYEPSHFFPFPTSYPIFPFHSMFKWKATGFSCKDFHLTFKENYDTEKVFYTFYLTTYLFCVYNICLFKKNVNTNLSILKLIQHNENKNYYQFLVVRDYTWKYYSDLDQKAY